MNQSEPLLKRLLSPITRHLNSNYPLRIAFFSIFFWSTQAVVMCFGTRDNTDFSTILFPGFLVSCIVLVVFKKFYDKKYFSSDVIAPLKEKYLHIILGSTLIFGSQFFFYYGIQIGPRTETNLTNYLWPLLFLLLGYLLFRESFIKSVRGQNLLATIRRTLKNGTVTFEPDVIKCDRMSFAKLAFGFLGISLVLVQGHFGEITLANWKGPIYGFIAGLIWAVFSVYLKFLGRVSYIALFIGGTTVWSGITWAMRGFHDLLPTMGYAIYLGILPLGFAMLTWERAMKSKHTQDIAMLAFLAPLLSTLFLVLFGVGNFNSWIVVGGIFIVISNIPFRETESRITNYIHSSKAALMTTHGISQRIIYYLLYIALFFLKIFHLPFMLMKKFLS